MQHTLYQKEHIELHARLSYADRHRISSGLTDGSNESAHGEPALCIECMLMRPENHGGMHEGDRDRAFRALLQFFEATAYVTTNACRMSMQCAMDTPFREAAGTYFTANTLGHLQLDCEYESSHMPSTYSCNTILKAPFREAAGAQHLAFNMHPVLKLPK